MKTILVSIQGDIHEDLYQLGLKERESFLRLEDRVTKLLSTNSFLRFGQNILVRARSIIKSKKKEELSVFEEFVESYARGLDVDLNRYLSFIAIFELAAHYGQVYPELKGLLPGCASVFHKGPEGVTHSRLVDFPLIGILDATPRLYHWKIEGKPTLLSFSCEGLAPLFFQAVHESGFSLALHHRPGGTYNRDGKSIFQIAFETLLESKTFSDVRKEIRTHASVTKWAFLVVDQKGRVEVMDIEGPSLNWQGFNLDEQSPLIFTNIPLSSDTEGFDSFLSFCHDREKWLKDKITKKPKDHILDLMTDVNDQKDKKWLHPGSTLSTTGALQINLTKGFLDLKEGQGPLVESDSIIRFSLGDKSDVSVLKEAKVQTPFEVAWKRAGKAQSFFDEGKFDEAYHELQMAHALVPNPIWKEIFAFYLVVWDFRFISNNRELGHVYKRLKRLKVPERLKDQWSMQVMRLEKKLGLVSTVKGEDLSPHLQELFQRELKASKPVFATWMNLLYPRMEILEVFSPHLKG